jgi:nitrogen regulatory protein PII
MKMITARIQSHRLEPVHEALVEIGIINLTATEIRAYAGETGHMEIYRGSKFQVDFMPMTKIETVVEDDQVKKVIGTIRQAGTEGRVMRFRIWITEVQVSEVEETAS